MFRKASTYPPVPSAPFRQRCQHQCWQQATSTLAVCNTYISSTQHWQYAHQHRQYATPILAVCNTNIGSMQHQHRQYVTQRLAVRNTKTGSMRHQHWWYATPTLTVCNINIDSIPTTTMAVLAWCCCSRINLSSPSNPVRGHGTGSTFSGVNEYLMKNKT